MFLFLASLVFYAWGEPCFVFLMLLSIVANWFWGLQVERYRNNPAGMKMILVIAITFNLAMIFIFKYLMFALHTVNSVLDKAILVPNIVLPIGISFFTFQAISYVVDIYRKKGRAQKNPLNVGLYIAFFPQLIAGPIVRDETVAEQIGNRRETGEQFASGVALFITGLGKKVIIANNLALLADAAFGAEVSGMSTGFAWLGAIAYSLQILFDFSGYSDMAVGLGRMFGFQFQKNFDYPYISGSITEFWRRWHISLGRWFRDYVYFPLGGNRVASQQRLIFNLFVVWFLTGLWHGANWTFIAWGLLYFVLLVMEKAGGLTKMEKMPILRHFYTLFFVQLGWVLFRSNSLESAYAYMKVLFGIHSGAFWDAKAYFYLCENAPFLMLGIFCSLPVLPLLSRFCKLHDNKIVGFLQPVLYLLIFLISLSYITKSSYNPFIYFNF